jgi:hypothetical protein
MRIILTLLIAILSVSCSQKDPRIDKFENVLGARKSIALTSLVSDFEENLFKLYPDLTLKQSYEQYLSDMLSDSITDWEKYRFQSDQTQTEFHESGLWDEIYEYEYSYSLGDSTKTKTIDSNNMGKYMAALYSIKDSDSLIKTYWKYREAGGLIQKEIVIPGLLSLEPDFGDYFHKRIVVVEFSF